MPPLPKSIALHVGAHKTASSHLQQTLYRNRTMLADEGIRVYGPGYLRQAGRSLESMFDLSWSITPSPRRDAEKQMRFLAKGYKRLVFTEENFVGPLADKDGRVPLPVYPLAEQRLEELLSKWSPIKLQLYVALRNPVSYLASAYSQVLFGGAHVGPRTFRARNDWRQLDWADYVARLRRLSGVGDIFVWRQEDYADTQSLIMRRLLRWRVGGKIELSHERVNRGMSVAAVRQTLSWQQEGREGDIGRDARSLFPINEENPAFKLYANATLAQADQIYAEQLARIEAMEGVTVLRSRTTPSGGQVEG